MRDGRQSGDQRQVERGLQVRRSSMFYDRLTLCPNFPPHFIADGDGLLFQTRILFFN